ncbi:MAG TPA: RNA polymerase sigma factor [Candidatus Methylacidiphilales bacterium]
MAHGTDPDLPLVAALQAGDERALDALMERHGEALFRFAHRYVGNAADAREVAQEAFVKAYFHIGTFRPGAFFSTWLYRIALNLCRDRARSRTFRDARRTDSISAPFPADDGGRREDLELAASAPDPADALIRAERLEAVGEGIAALPPELKAPFVLAALEGLSHEEAGLRLGLTAKAVEAKVYRARKLLSKRLAGTDVR